MKEAQAAAKRAALSGSKPKTAGAKTRSGASTTMISSNMTSSIERNVSSRKEQRQTNLRAEGIIIKKQQSEQRQNKIR